MAVVHAGVDDVAGDGIGAFATEVAARAVATAASAGVGDRLYLRDVVRSDLVSAAAMSVNSRSEAYESNLRGRGREHGAARHFRHRWMRGKFLYLVRRCVEVRGGDERVRLVVRFIYLPPRYRYRQWD